MWPRFDPAGFSLLLILAFLPSQKPTSPNSNYIGIEDPHVKAKTNSTHCNLAKENRVTAGADPGFYLEGGAPLRKGITG